MMRRKEKILIAFSIVALAATAMASETVTYTYDVRGRLVQVKHSGTKNDNVITNYGFDKADNRTLKNTTGASQ